MKNRDKTDNVKSALLLMVFLTACTGVWADTVTISDKGGKRSYITGCGDADELVFMGQPIVRRNETVLRNCSDCCGETDGCPGVIICKFCITFTLFYRYYLSEFTLYLLRNGFDRCCK